MKTPINEHGVFVNPETLRVHSQPPRRHALIHLADFSAAPGEKPGWSYSLDIHAGGWGTASLPSRRSTRYPSRSEALDAAYCEMKTDILRFLRHHYSHNTNGPEARKFLIETLRIIEQRKQLSLF